MIILDGRVWYVAEEVLADYIEDYNPFETTFDEDLQLLTELGKTLNFTVCYRHASRGVFVDLVFDDPHRELLFRLKHPYRYDYI